MGANKPAGENSPVSLVASERLDSWKEIAAHLKRDVRTVQRWEQDEGLPVRRHLHKKLGSVYAYKAELDAWWNNHQPRFEQEVEKSRGLRAIRPRWGMPVAISVLLIAAGHCIVA